ncbi:MAG TPA: acetyl-CoA carboxylase biotin carboxyl carrier protein [Pirellulaceae bacterium]|nr:acetyl-CoA carboxylase biotin carboxyl carrier protein [Pirellulaceae bacterium]
MSDPEPQSEPVFDVDRVRQLVDLMKQHDLSEISLQNGNRRIRLRRGPLQGPTFVAGAPAAAPMAYAAPAPAPAAGSSPSGGGAPQADPNANAVFIKSPMVGTFYSKPNPKAKSYVQPGDRVTPETIVCQIEAMKTFSEIPAGVSGTIAAMLVRDEEPVDVDKPLFRLDP